ncbi:SDR family NAD(P)-dependent oxidoreductase [Nonomuraea fuscirosea]|uniref:SDR family NAD(P)-dependent oxidoreductase n=1 Tax=Nonomuraea fuscirosea TaxID=1291556 RepID=UPI00342185EF
MAKTWLIAGASRGFGRRLTEAVLEAGDQVIATARSPKQLDDLVARHSGRIRAVSLDVTDAAAASRAVKEATDTFGSLDVVVNNAGYGNSAPIEEMAEDDFRAQIETNLFGVVNVTRAALPVLRTQRSGVFVQFSSIGGRVGGTPGMGAYQAAKFAVEGFTEDLWQEIEPLGLNAMIVQPGSFRTGIEHRTKASGTPIDAYHATAGAFRNMMGTLTPEMFPGDHTRAAKVMYAAATSKQPRHWIVLGSDAHRRIDAKLSRLRAEFDRGKDVALSTDFPGSAEHAVL